MTTEAELLIKSIETMRTEQYEEIRSKQRREELDRWVKHVDPIVKILRQRAWPVIFKPEEKVLVISNIDCHWLIDIKQEYTTSTWRSHPTGKLRMTIGDYGSRQSYRQLKDGTFSYDKIVEKILEHVRHKAAVNDAQARRNVNKAIAEQFRKDNDLCDYGWFSSSTNLEKPINISMNLKRDMTVEQATRLVEALKAIGIKPY